MTERERFENWARRSDANPLLNRAEHDGKKLDEYHFPLARAMWEAWQAARAASPKSGKLKLPDIQAIAAELQSVGALQALASLVDEAFRLNLSELHGEDWSKYAVAISDAKSRIEASPKVPQGVGPLVMQLQMVDRGHRKGFCDVDDETGTMFSNVPMKWAQEIIETFCDAARYRALSRPATQLPQGVEDAYQALQNELIQIQATIESFATPAAALSALIDWHVAVATDPRVNGGMALVPVEPTDEMVDAGYGALPDCKCTEGDKWRAKLVYKAMLAATKDRKCQS